MHFADAPRLDGEALAGARWLEAISLKVARSTSRNQKHQKVTHKASVQEEAIFLHVHCQLLQTIMGSY